ncbi:MULTISPECIES: hypothetical protein [Klebsiella]|uniref:hypothetical protein n=1 Tax=Klebsiella TaxID=570 RepID=UPI002B053D24|nr:hypothetical protein [Klebsiella variicola]MEB6354986.1 hypothetical protein [Klebsiella variicola]HCF7788067.1 hypothetical protein [Klebsiella variicola subsp. variicola]
MLDRQTLELTLLAIARKKGEPLDRHTLFSVRNDVRNALAAKERFKQRITAKPYQWKKPAPPRG